MKQLFSTTIAAVVLVGCGGSQQSAPVPETKPVSEAAKPEPPTAKAPDISIHDAAKGVNIKAVKQHLAAGTDVNAKDKHGGTPLYWAAFGVSPSSSAQSGGGHKEVAELLIAAGADVNAKNDGGWTPLHRAANRGQKETAELLIGKGADVNVKEETLGNTPLDSARFHHEIVDLLRKHGGKTGEELNGNEHP